MVKLSHPYMPPGKTIALIIWTFVSKVISLLFKTLSNFVIAFLLRSKHLLISWLQSPSAKGMVAFTHFLKRITISQNKNSLKIFKSNLKNNMKHIICDWEIEEGGPLWKGGTIRDTLPFGRTSISTLMVSRVTKIFPNITCILKLSVTAWNCTEKNLLNI